MPPRARKTAAKRTTAKGPGGTVGTAASRRARATKAPTDRKAPARQLAAEVAASEYVFEHGGETYFLPNAAPYAQQISGGLLMDAVLDGSEEAQGTLAIKIFAMAKDDIETEAWEAMRAKPAEEFITTVGKWLQAAGVELGK